MRKIFLIVFIFLLVGCNLSNNPTSLVEELLGKYQRLDKEITYNYLELSGDASINDTIRDGYIDIVKRQYRNMTYEIKDESIDGDIATVIVQIEVINYKKVLDDYADSMVHDDVINKLRKVNEKVNYTIEFIVNKDNKGIWELENLTDEMQKKLLGIY